MERPISWRRAAQQSHCAWSVSPKPHAVGAWSSRARSCPRYPTYVRGIDVVAPGEALDRGLAHILVVDASQ